ncbi:MAG: peptidoglycan DD-metalloendopeptidase family protein [Myxococcota bacterium]|nr:peptidoglycan DD-metalloendopeptidase family protein [Myxococcota bacterium]
MAGARAWRWIAVLFGVGLAGLGPTCGPVEEPPPAAVQDDADGDGFVDALDVCAAIADPDQRDSDRDGFGDACDADYDQNGAVGLSDFNALRARFGLTAGDSGFDPRFDHDGSGGIGIGDFNRLRALFGGPPGPSGSDQDGDGLSLHDGSDRCPGTAAGAEIVALGCSLLDLIGRPEPLFQPLLLETGAFAEDFGGLEHLEGVVRRVGEGESLLRSALGAALRGAPCEAATLAEDALAPIGAARSEVFVLQRLARADVPDPPPAQDVNEPEQVVEEYAYLADRLRDLLAAVDDTAALETEACDGSTRGARTLGRIARIDEGNARIELADGRTLYFGEGFRVVPAPRSSYAELAEGVEALFVGTLVSDGGFAQQAQPAAVPEDQPELGLAPCAEFRFAPLQRFPPAPDAGPYQLLHPDAYLVLGRHRLEEGMRLGVEWSCPTPAPPSWPRYSMRVELTWTPPGAPGPQTDVLAVDLDASDAPLALPWQLGDGDEATLDVTLQKQTCSGNPFVPFGATCGPKIDQSGDSYPITMVARGSRCVALYSETVVSIDDQIPDDMQAVRVDDVVALHPSDTDLTFEAEGYAAIPPALPLFSSFPVVVDLVGGQPFTLHNTDFWPIHGTSNALQSIFLSITQGVTKAAGVRWPRVRGRWNGREWTFSCSLPDVVRDVVNFCPGETTDAFYRLPFAAGDTAWTQGQGNDGSFTHSGGFAYDMGAPLGQTIRAARAGRVVWVKEDETQQCGCTGCPGSPACPVTANQVFVRHQDGTFGQYVHPPQNGIDPELNDVVKRGQQLAVVGVTGNTTGPHLHFAEKFVLTLNGSTSLALFEALNPFDTSQVLTCYEPPNIETGSGVPLRSNNAPQ